MKGKKLAVYCGSSSGNLPCYSQETIALGTLMAKRGVTLVYGGARFGLMGALADSVLAGGGDVIGVIPESVLLLRKKKKAGTSTGTDTSSSSVTSTIQLRFAL